MAKGELVWNEERIATLARLAGEGQSKTQIATQMQLSEEAISKASSKFKISISRPSRKAGLPADVWWRWLLHQMPRPGHGQLAG